MESNSPRSLDFEAEIDTLQLRPSFSLLLRAFFLVMLRMGWAPQGLIHHSCPTQIIRHPILLNLVETISPCPSFDLKNNNPKLASTAGFLAY